MDTNNTIPKQNTQPVASSKTLSEIPTPEVSIPATTPVAPDSQYQGVLNNYQDEINPPIIPPATETTTTTKTVPVSPTLETPTPDYSNPEIAQKKLEEILNTPSNLPPVENSIPVGPPVDTSPKSSAFRVIFLVSLLLFLGVSAAVAYFFIKGPTSTPTETPVVIPVVTQVPTVEPTVAPTNICNLNGKTYKVGETFAAADSCNICSCAADLSITCTQRVCSSTPSATISPTKAATPSAITPTKAATATPTQAL